MTILKQTSVTLQWTSGWKYQVVEEITWELRCNFKPLMEHHTNYYELWHHDGRWFITIYAGCCWDGPTWFPDFVWMMLASLIHDVLHWLIAAGAISTNSNDLIDAELAGIVRMQKERLSGLRAWYIEKATNRVDQKAGEQKEIFTYDLQLT